MGTQIIFQGDMKKLLSLYQHPSFQKFGRFFVPSLLANVAWMEQHNIRKNKIASPQRPTSIFPLFLYVGLV